MFGSSLTILVQHILLASGDRLKVMEYEKNPSEKFLQLAQVFVWFIYQILILQRIGVGKHYLLQSVDPISVDYVLYLEASSYKQCCVG